VQNEQEIIDPSSTHPSFGGFESMILSI
jgi:hypothetical protein